MNNLNNWDINQVERDDWNLAIGVANKLLETEISEEDRKRTQYALVNLEKNNASSQDIAAAISLMKILGVKYNVEGKSRRQIKF